MRTRNSYFPNNSSITISRRRNKRRTPNVVKPELRTIVEMADDRIMEELLQAPTEGYGEAIVTPEINADHFEIKTNFLQLVQVNPYHGFERENPHTHINKFKRITSTLKFKDVPNDVIKLMMFLYSLEGNARIWDSLACLKLSLGSSIYIVVWKSIQYGVLELNTTYQGCLAWAPRITYSKIHAREIGYDVSNLLDMMYRTYWVRRIELFRYGVLGYFGTTYWATPVRSFIHHGYSILGFLGMEYWLKVCFS
nr:reverse transcriptase domain-containing protein [Tanacetum cinerariifolium]